jgi:hypothetical protein
MPKDFKVQRLSDEFGYSPSGRAIHPRRFAVRAPLRSSQCIHALSFADVRLTLRSPGTGELEA